MGSELDCDTVTIALCPICQSRHGLFDHSRATASAAGQYLLRQGELGRGVRLPHQEVGPSEQGPGGGLQEGTLSLEYGGQSSGGGLARIATCGLGVQAQDLSAKGKVSVESRGDLGQVQLRSEGVLCGQKLPNVSEQDVALVQDAASLLHGKGCQAACCSGGGRSNLSAHHVAEGGHSLPPGGRTLHSPSLGRPHDVLPHLRNEAPGSGCEVVRERRRCVVDLEEGFLQERLEGLVDRVAERLARLLFLSSAREENYLSVRGVDKRRCSFAQSAGFPRLEERNGEEVGEVDLVRSHVRARRRGEDRLARAKGRLLPVPIVPLQVLHDEFGPRLGALVEPFPLVAALVSAAITAVPPPLVAPSPSATLPRRPFLLCQRGLPRRLDGSRQRRLHSPDFLSHIRVGRVGEADEVRALREMESKFLFCSSLWYDGLSYITVAGPPLPRVVGAPTTHMVVISLLPAPGREEQDLSVGHAQSQGRGSLGQCRHAGLRCVVTLSRVQPPVVVAHP